jgi:DeoR family transcriptional regulator, fructose operon transcriptional repressor
MEASDRRLQILALARSDGRVHVGSLAEALHVAPETVRRDLRELAERGMLQRVHGGAHPVESVGYESNLAHRSTSLLSEKTRIAAAAATRLDGAESVYIDEGVTPKLVADAIAKALKPGDKLTVVTSSLPAAGVLAERPGVNVVVLGGRLRGLTMGTVGHWTTGMLQELVIDLAFLGANGIARQHGLTTPDPAVAAVKAQVVRSARRSIFVGVHTKFGVSSFCRFAEVADMEALITDTGVSATEANRFSVLGPEVVRA